MMDRGWQKDWNQYLMKRWSMEYLFLWSISLNIAVLRHWPKTESKTIERWKSIGKGNLRWIIRWKSSKLVFHAPMLIARWESKVKGTFMWIISLWNLSLKTLKFWLNTVTSPTQNWLEKGSNLVSHVPMLIEKSKSKVKGTLRWSIR